MFRKRWLIPLAILLATPGFAAREAGPIAYDEPSAAADDYSTGDYGRIREMDESVELQRAAGEDDRAKAAVNAPIFPGDAMRTRSGSRAEVELAAGNVIWLEGGTSLLFLALPSPYAESEDKTVLQLKNGTMRLERPRRAAGDFRVDSPFGSVWISEGSDVRLETNGRNQLQVYVFRGSAGISTDSNELRLEAGERTTAYESGSIDRAYVFNTTLTDRFDEWVLDRRELWNSYARSYDDDNINLDEVYEDVPSEIRPYWRELNRSGRWIYDDEYGYVWSPANVSSNWRPYSDGYWSYGSRGYFWVASEPWGWAPYRYGRWNYLSGFGWCWAPGRVFGGAWVSWSWGSAYIGWSPLNYYNQPAYYGPRYYGYYDPYCWNFISYSRFGYYNHHRSYVHVNVIGDNLRHHAVVTRAPRVAPGALVDDRQVRDRAVRTARSSNTRIGTTNLDTRDNARRFRDVEKEERRDRSARSGGTRKPGVGAARVSKEDRTNQRGPGAASRNTADSLGTRQTTGRTAERATGSRNTDESKQRTRDLYKKMTAPRETRPRTERPSRDTPTQDRQVRPSRPSREGNSDSGSKARPSRPAPSRDRQVRPSRPSREGTSGSGSQARPSRPAPSRDRQVRPSRPSREGTSGSRPQARPSRGSSSGSRPQARPSRGGSSGSKPQARPSRGSSSGSKPKARPSRGSSSGAKPSKSKSSGSGKSSGGKSSRGKASRGS